MMAHIRIFIPIVAASALSAAQAADTGTLIVSLIGEGKVALFDAKTMRQTAAVDVGMGPHEIRLAPNGRLAYVALAGNRPGGGNGRQVAVIDLKTRSLKARFDLKDYLSPHDVRVSHDGRRLWVACAPARSVLELDSRTGAILRRYDTGAAGSSFVEVSLDERRLFTSNLQGESISVIERSTGAVTVIPMNSGVYGIDITPDGRELWVTGSGIAVIDVHTGSIKQRIPAPEADVGRIRISANGKLAVIDSDSSKNVWVFETTSKKLIRSIATNSEHKVLTLSADGQRAFLSNPDVDTVTILDLVAGREIGAFKVGKKPDGIAFVR